MKTTDLINAWGGPDNSRVTAKQVSFRLPVHVAAKLSALCDLYPNKTKTEIVGDLLATALDELERALPSFQGAEIERDNETDEQLYETTGPLIEYRHLVDQYYLQLERELGNLKPKPLYYPESAKAGSAV